MPASSRFGAVRWTAVARLVAAVALTMVVSQQRTVLAAREMVGTLSEPSIHAVGMLVGGMPSPDPDSLIAQTPLITANQCAAGCLAVQTTAPFDARPIRSVVLRI